jgi:hypothetical protein
MREMAHQVDRPGQQARTAHLQRTLPAGPQHPTRVLEVAQDRRPVRDVLQGDVGEDVINRTVADGVQVATRAKDPPDVVVVGQAGLSLSEHLVRHVQRHHLSVQLGEPPRHSSRPAAKLQQHLGL